MKLVLILKIEDKKNCQYCSAVYAVYNVYTPIYTLGLSQSADVIFYYIIQSEKSCCKQRKNHINIRRKYIKILTKLIIMPEI